MNKKTKEQNNQNEARPNASEGAHDRLLGGVDDLDNDLIEHIKKTLSIIMKPVFLIIFNLLIAYFVFHEVQNVETGWKFVITYLSGSTALLLSIMYRSWLDK